MSRALFEQVAFNKKQVTSLDWVTYPILRFKDAPKVDIRLHPALRHPGDSTGTAQANGTTRPRRHRRRDAASSCPARASRRSPRSARRSPTRSSTPRVSASAGADDAGARPRGAEGGRGRLDPDERDSDARRSGPAKGPDVVNRRGWRLSGRRAWRRSCPEPSRASTCRRSGSRVTVFLPTKAAVGEGHRLALAPAAPMKTALRRSCR